MNHHSYQQASYLQSRSVYDWLWAVLLLVAIGYLFGQYQTLMDGYETVSYWRFLVMVMI